MRNVKGLYIGAAFAAVMLGVLWAPPGALAQITTIIEPLVPCSGLDCQACDLAKLAQRIIRFLVVIAVPIAALLFAWAGVLYFSSAGNPGQVTKAKGIFVNVLIGFIVALSSFLIVEVILNTLVKDSAVRGKWFTIQCVDQSLRKGASSSRVQGASAAQPVSGVPSAQSGASAPASSPAPKPTCSGCTQITAIAVKAGAGDQVEKDLNLRLTAFAGHLGSLAGDVRVNEGYPPTITHQSSCHNNGTCIDLGFKSGAYTTDKMLAVQNAAKESGLCTVYEPTGSCAGLSGVVCLDNSVTHSTGNHFSVYKEGSPGCRSI